MCNCQKPHRWPLMVRLGSGTAVRPDSKLPQLTPRLLRWLKIFDSSMIDWRPSVRDQIPRYMWRKARLRKKGKKGENNGKYIFWKTSFRRPFSKAFLDEAPACQDVLRQSFCTGITTVLALRQDTIQFIPGKRGLLAVRLLTTVHQVAESAQV